MPRPPTAAARSMAVRHAALKAGEACATKLQDGLTTTAQTFDECTSLFCPSPARHMHLLHDALSPPPSTVHRLMKMAEEINRDRAELGEEVTLKLLTKCQENVRALHMVEAQQQAHKSSLTGLRTELPEEVVPTELQRVFAESLKKHTEAHTGRADVEQRREMRQLRALMAGDTADAGIEEGGDGCASLTVHPHSPPPPLPLHAKRTAVSAR